jgi:hypothetical protein
MPTFTDEECIYFYLMGAGTAYLSSNEFLDTYGFGPMEGRKKKAEVVHGFIAPDCQWLTFIKNVNALYSASASKLMAKKKATQVTATIARGARREVATVLAHSGTGPGLIVEMFVPNVIGSHFFSMRHDGIIANGYPDSVFNPASNRSGVGLGLGFQKDHSHGFCQTFAIMWLLISQKSKQSVDVSLPSWTTKTGWKRLCAAWHDTIWVNLKNSEEDAKVISTKKELMATPDGKADDLEETIEKLRDKIYLHNAGLALRFLTEFTEHCNYAYTVAEVVKLCGSISVRDCPNFSVEVMTKFLGTMTEKVDVGDGPEDRVTLHRIFKYLRSQGVGFLEKWFED